MFPFQIRAMPGRWSVLVLAAALLLSACGGESAPPPAAEGTATPVPTVEAPAEPTEPAAEAGEVAAGEAVTETGEITAPQEVIGTAEVTRTEEVTEAEQATATEQATGSEDATGAAAEMATASLNDVSFDYPAYLANDVEAREVEATPVQPDTPSGDEAPAHLQFSFVDYYPDDSPELQLLPRPYPAQVQVYDTSGFVDYTLSEDDEVGFETELTKLQALLAARPDLAEQALLPFLPLIGASQVMHTAQTYLEFDGGAGIRYLTYFAQDLAPLVEGDIFYTFQGVTDDGSRFVVATFPVDTGILPNDQPDDLDYAAWAATADDYYADLAAQVNALAPDDFTPSLDALDGIVTSLRIGGSD